MDNRAGVGSEIAEPHLGHGHRQIGANRNLGIGLERGDLLIGERMAETAKLPDRPRTIRSVGVCQRGLETRDAWDAEMGGNAGRFRRIITAAFLFRLEIKLQNLSARDALAQKGRISLISERNSPLEVGGMDSQRSK